MKLIRKPEELFHELEKFWKKGVPMGFVPTMGALHDGHISLINRAKAENSIVVASIFVNPAQFNNPVDLVNYPRTPETDHNLLEKADLDFLFEPAVPDIYPDGYQSVAENLDFGKLVTVMEGKFRPGHFKGVAKVVARLFEIVKPVRAYFGEKDFQQLAVIREMVKKLEMQVEIIGCPTMRTASGLALSSRNIHLNAEELMGSPVIFETLKQTREMINSHGLSEGIGIMTDKIESVAGFKVEYLEVVDAATLQPVEGIAENNSLRVCTAVRTSATRLIDNMEV